MEKSIVVIGSTNTDIVVVSERLPKAGETILGGDLLINQGGKGANQAVAVHRLGGKLAFIAKVGNDMFGQQAVAHFESEGIDTQHIFRDEDAASGVALIAVDRQGENSIIVAPGANGKLWPEHVDQKQAVIAQASYILMQLETPIETILHAAKLAKSAGAMVVLNPAPAQALPEELWSSIDILTPNETEAELLTGVAVVDEKTAESAAAQLRDKGIETVIITLGANGAYVDSPGVKGMISAQPTIAIDTTAAGDVFNGALVTGLSEGMFVDQAVKFAHQAAAIAVSRRGAQASIPYREEV